jgi:hypothetical protein
MARTVNIDLERVTPTVDAILAGQGIPADVHRDERTLGLAEDAVRLFRELAEPAGIETEVTPEEFAELYRGEGLNADDTPLDEIAPRVSHMSLFAVTLGESICGRIGQLFDENEFAAGAMLDAAASAGADFAAETLEADFERELRLAGRLDEGSSAMRFSPGYCGWHVSGQKKLFARLRPDAIGIELNASCLMQPLKSVSGVIVGGSIKLFDIDDTYSFCTDCPTHSCKDRFESLKKRNAGS